MPAWLRTRRALVIAVAVAIGLASLAVAPWALWHAMDERPLDVLIVDKTVPTSNLREHAGLVWILRHEKVVQRATGRLVDQGRDYSGYHHGPDGERTIVPIPDRPTDLVYLADTYGVYEADLSGHPLGEHSRLVYGGLSLREVTTITRNLRPGATIVGEFNCLASPTTRAAREALGEAFGVSWTGWIGRHFPYLDLGPDLPPWLPRAWTRQTGERWQFRGPGYVLVDENGLIVVLLEGVDTPRAALRLRVDTKAADRFDATSDPMAYDAWFEIVRARPGAEVLGSFELALTESGRRKTGGVPVDTPFPAILRIAHARYQSYYFAGDFADQSVPPGAFRYRWLPEIRALLGAEHRDDPQAVYWHVYVPIMQRVIRRAAAAARSPQGSRTDAAAG